MVNVTQGLPGETPLVTPGGIVTPAWIRFFLTLYQRTGGATGSLSLQLDTIAAGIGSMLRRGLTEWEGLDPGTQYQVLRMGAALQAWEFLDGNSFGDQAVHQVFASPTGSPGKPLFRAIESADMPPGQYPATATNDDATAGIVGEFISSQVNSGSAVALTSGVAADITSISLPPGNWLVWGNVANTGDPATTVSNIRGWIHTVSATNPGAPNQGAFFFDRTALAAGNTSVVHPVGQIRIKVPPGPNQTVYLGTIATFAVNSYSAYGFIGAIRPR